MALQRKKKRRYRFNLQNISLWTLECELSPLWSLLLRLSLLRSQFTWFSTLLSLECIFSSVSVHFAKLKEIMKNCVSSLRWGHFAHSVTWRADYCFCLVARNVRSSGTIDVSNFNWWSDYICTRHHSHHLLPSILFSFSIQFTFLSSRTNPYLGRRYFHKTSFMFP